jgi:signal peptidase II
VPEGAGRSWARAGLLTAGVVALDQATKALVRATITPGQREAVLPGVDLVHTHNTGVAFGALSGGGAIVTAVVAVALVGLLGYFATHVSRPLFWLPTGMLFGGAVGNVVDRVREGAVTDFIQLPLGFPAFNVADMSITVGVLLLLYVLERDGAHGDER